MIYFLTYLLVFSIVTFILYGVDKRKAIKREWRTKEKTLLGCSFLGGAIGGLSGMLVFRHKTKAEHWYFWAVNILGIAWQAVACVVIYNNYGIGL